jgi:hypothetical protein
MSYINSCLTGCTSSSVKRASYTLRVYMPNPIIASLTGTYRVNKDSARLYAQQSSIANHIRRVYMHFGVRMIGIGGEIPTKMYLGESAIDRKPSWGWRYS